MTENIGELAAALAKAQAAFPAIKRDKEVDSRSYKFKYAPLDSILDAVRKPLADNGLAVSQVLDGGDLVTYLLHSSGASLSGRVPLHQDGGTIQQLGSAVTYLRRYALQAILGIAAEEDDDGNAAPVRAAARPATNGRPQRVDPQTGEIIPPLRHDAPRAPEAAQERPALSDADIAALHGRFGADQDDAARPFAPADIDAAVTSGLSTGELFSLAEEEGVTRAQLTVGAKTLFGANRWKITDLSDEDRLALWEEVRPVTA